MINFMASQYVLIYWAIAYCVFLCFYSRYLFKTFHWSFALAMAYTIAQTLFSSEWLDWKEPYSMPVNLVLKTQFLGALFILLGSVWILERLKPNPKWLGYLCVTNIALTIVFIPIHFEKDWLIGLCMNPAMNGAITAITLPFLFSLNEAFVFPLFLVGVILIFMSHSTTPVFALLASFFGPSFFASRRKTRFMAIAVVAIALLCYLVPDFSNASDRMTNWVFFGKYWWHHFNVFFGSGNDSFTIWGPVIQKMDTVVTDNFLASFLPRLGDHFTGYQGPTHWYWLWLHSDIYQTLFELGIIGLVLWSIAVWTALRSMRKNEMFLGGSLAWLVTASLYYPLHFPVQLFIGLFLISFAIKKKV